MTLLRKILLYFSLFILFFLLSPKSILGFSSGELFISTYAEGNVYRIDLNDFSKELIKTGMILPMDLVCGNDDKDIILGYLSMTKFDKYGENIVNYNVNYQRPSGVDTDNYGNIFFSTRSPKSNGLWKIDPIHPQDNPIQIVPMYTQSGYGLVVKDNGDILTTATNGRIVISHAPDYGSVENFITGLGYPIGLDTDKDGNIYISDDTTDRVTKHSPSGELIKVLAENIPDPRFIEVDFNGDVYVVNEYAGNIIKISPDGIKTIVVTGLDRPNGLTLCGDGDTNNIKPFLDLPWDYRSIGMSFSDAALSINSFFDHEYPLLSTSMIESVNSNLDIRPYSPFVSIDSPYTSHDGYDWGRKAGTKFRVPQLAAADGVAEYRNSCGACGNAILIDHQNGYQTRYYHLEKDELITTVPGAKIPVIKGQKIGLTGFSGNVKPKGEDGSHIHFMVVQDKNNDGNFDDNIPDGLTDPFGWQSNDPDPWPNFSFNYLGVNRTGNISNYLWTNTLPNLNKSLDSDGGIVELEKYKFDIPSSAVSETLNFSMKSGFAQDLSESIKSVGSSIVVSVTDVIGNTINTLDDSYTLFVDYSTLDISKYDTSTLSIYSSEDGEIWNKEETELNIGDKIAKTTLSHFSHFTLMAELLDHTSPSTTINFSSLEGDKDWFRSDAVISFDSADNEDGSGVLYTAYRIDDNDFEKYNSPFTVSNEGKHKIEYYSEDEDGNVEDLKSTEFNIDKTYPEAKMIFDLNTKELLVIGTDDNYKETIKTGITHINNKVLISDRSGNTLLIGGDIISLKDSISISLKELNYNSGLLLINPDENLFGVRFTYDRANNLTRFVQGWSMGDIDYRLSFDPVNNETKISEKQNTDEIIENIIQGRKMLFLKTDNGNLNYGLE